MEDSTESQPTAREMAAAIIELAGGSVEARHGNEGSSGLASQEIVIAPEGARELDRLLTHEGRHVDDWSISDEWYGHDHLVQGHDDLSQRWNKMRARGMRTIVVPSGDPCKFGRSAR